MRYFALFLKKLLRFILKPLSFLPAIVVMYMIFSFSAQQGVTSADLSYKVAHRIIVEVNEQLDKDWSEEQIAYYTDKIHFYVRKTAHVTEYFVLAVTVAFPLYVYRLRGIPLVIIAGAFCVGFAGLDEYHQSFVAGRTATIRDVKIDSIGIFVGIILVRIVGWTGRMTIFRPLSLEKKKKRKPSYRHRRHD